jgi:hypothetical protein
MDIEKAKLLVDEFFEKRPTKDIYEKCLIELLTEKHKLITNEECDKVIIEKIDKVIESIQQYLQIASK